MWLCLSHYSAVSMCFITLFCVIRSVDLSKFGRMCGTEISRMSTNSHICANMNESITTGMYKMMSNKLGSMGPLLGVSGSGTCVYDPWSLPSQADRGEPDRPWWCEDHRCPRPHVDARGHRRAHALPDARQGHVCGRRLLPGHPRRTGWGHHHDQYVYQQSVFMPVNNI